jgi:hypothetical protein
VPRFVILEHTGTPEYKPGVHWDLMLEVGDRLRTWELQSPPAPGANIAALPLADHRLDYLEYEGPISNNRGTVRQWDRGNFRIVAESQTELALEITGDTLRGHLTLSRDATDPSRYWLVVSRRSDD